MLKLDHIGVAVTDLAQAIEAYQSLGLSLAHREVVERDAVEVAFLPFEGGRFELLAPHDETSPVARFLAKRGPGIHHVALAVDHLQAVLAQLKALGLTLIDQEPRPGAEGSQVAFIHPSAMGGVLVELVEHPNKEALRD
ncbi:glyoxalase family protein [Sulfobacillus acidophilus TPY]|uniref:Methylmalonyl-CoA epimerase n=1 Tax=Sulfobacillus acidophilus (strain ATCC 700253 / DSM 10332 / NAL) TaxID=679936 RepID=G8TX01_SULAD|nr:glyoxalase family protein [Sulfobacillus acidophilus TPY]AEW04909.1 methylmalonyl-CoA epimerase [Sulfobacillus acidophilus DSM 10332]